jgi:NAD(P)H-hydrate repair Nnr-like enzyme with NAD(P)H-hydrate epimerase domain
VENKDNAQSNQCYLIKEDGAPVPVVSRAALARGLTECWNSYHLSPLQAIESASFSFAMVVRFALGLSAQDGLVTAIVRPGLAGAVALATLRHLHNSGAESVVIVIDGDSNPVTDSLFAESLKTIQALNIGVQYLQNLDTMPAVEDVCKACHTTLMGIVDPLSSDKITNPLINSLVEILNDLSTPIHTVIAPYGVNLDSGAITGELLYASSTLSLGAPLSVLVDSKSIKNTCDDTDAPFSLKKCKAIEAAGKLFLADISLPPLVYQGLSPAFPYLFAEQPVVRLINSEIEEEL